MTSTQTTASDLVTAAMSIADDAAQGRLNPADLERQAIAELQALVGEVIGPDDLAWDLQLQITRGVLAAGGVPADELSEWLAVARHRAGEPVSQPGLPDDPPPVESLPSGMLSADSDAAELADADPEQPVVADAEQPVDPPPPTPPRPDQYDPLAAWSPGRTLRRPL